MINLRFLADLLSSKRSKINSSSIVSCELCSSNAIYASTRKAFNYYECENCNFLFIYPKPSTSLIQELYTQQEKIDTTVQQKLGRLISKIQALKISQEAYILDIGSQNGDFLKRLPKDFHWKLFGVEPSIPRNVALHFEPLISIKKGFFNSSDYEKNQFELVNLGDVIEHLEDPEKLVSEVQKICKVDGYFIVTTPVTDCPYVQTSNFFHELFGNLSPQA